VAKAGKKTTKKDASGQEVVAQNRAASYNYHLLEKMEAGMALVGTEVKALREGKANLRDAYAEVRGTSVWLVNCHIPQYNPGGPFNHEPLSRRRLLLHRQEIDKLIGKVQRAGYTLMPLDLHFKNGRIKLNIGLAKGKKQHDKRSTEKERDSKMEAQQAMKKERR